MCGFGSWEAEPRQQKTLLPTDSIKQTGQKYPVVTFGKSGITLAVAAISSAWMSCSWLRYCEKLFLLEKLVRHLRKLALGIRAERKDHSFFSPL